MKFEIKNRWNGESLYIADIPDGTESGLHARIALEQATAAGASLANASLTYANLAYANLECADLAGANLTGANLNGATLAGANLTYASLKRADLARAYLTGAYLNGAILDSANLARANLARADLSDAILADAILTDAILNGANLDATSLFSTIGDSRHIKTLQTDLWTVTYTDTHMQIGCQRHELARWWDFTPQQIDRMDSRASEWWARWKPVLQQVIEISPAVPIGYVKPEK